MGPRNPHKTTGDKPIACNNSTGGYNGKHPMMGFPWCSARLRAGYLMVILTLPTRVSSIKVLLNHISFPVLALKDQRRILGPDSSRSPEYYVMPFQENPAMRAENS